MGYSNQSAWLIAASVGLGGALSACSKEEPPPASAAAVDRAETFRFAPPDGTEYVRTDRRTEELSIVGEPLRQVDRQELRWRTRVGRSGDEYRVTQDLLYVSLARDDETLLEGKVPEGISATLLLDERGKLAGVTGLERTAETLRSLVAPEKEAEAARVITTDSLADIVATRYKVVFEDTIGRPASPGSTWTLENPPGSFVTSRTVTVTGHEACGAATCARLEVEFQIDPKVVTKAGVDIIRSSMSAAGEDPSRVSVQSASYQMSGWMLVEPATMLSHGASLTEGGTIEVVGAAGRTVTIQIKGTTDLSYSYGEARTSRQPSWTEPRVASE
jgi:hypothetical protein